MGDAGEGAPNGQTGAYGGLELLTVDEMAAADRAAVAAGIAVETLMEAAGRAVVAAILARFAPQPVAVLCGPGNNGGDGFVIATLLAARGWPVTLAAARPLADYGGAAGAQGARWRGPVLGLEPRALDGARLVVDALFGAGLNRPVAGAAATLLRAVQTRALPMVAVDMPSGVNGDSGLVQGIAVPARLTVSFFRAKPGHFLMPGRGLCGELVIADIGIPASVLDAIQPLIRLNDPALWRAALPRPRPSGHKYDRGHLLVVGGAMTGAAPPGRARRPAHRCRSADGGVRDGRSCDLRRRPAGPDRARGAGPGRAVPARR